MFGIILFRARSFQRVSRWSLTEEARVNPCGICGGQSGTGRGYSPIFFSGFLLSVSFHHCSILIYRCPMRCSTALTKQHLIIPSVLTYGFISDLTHGWNRRKWYIFILFLALAGLLKQRGSSYWQNIQHA
jgi:hypothetical protein